MWEGGKSFSLEISEAKLVFRVATDFSAPISRGASLMSTRVGRGSRALA